MSKAEVVADGIATQESQKRELFDWWEAKAYQRTPAAGFVSTNPRLDEFLAMVKRCECGKWHLQMDQKCKECK